MKKLTKILSVCLVFSMLFCFSYTSVFANDVPATPETDTCEIDPRDYPENSRERFVASLALKENISYEEADLLERQETAKMRRGPDEVLRYKTVDKFAGSVQGVNGYTERVNIATEIRYTFNLGLNRPSSLESIGGPIIYVPGASSYTLLTSNFNIEKYSLSGRVSNTASMQYTIPGASVSVGGDIMSVTTSSGNTTVTTRAKTFVIYIDETDML